MRSSVFCLSYVVILSHPQNELLVYHCLIRSDYGEVVRASPSECRYIDHRLLRIMLRSLKRFVELYTFSFTSGLALSSLIDVLVTGLLCYLLLNHKQNSKYACLSMIQLK